MDIQLQCCELKDVIKVNDGDNFYDSGMRYVGMALVVFEEISNVYYDEILNLKRLI